MISKRLGKAFAAFLMWLIFGLVALVTIVLQLLGILIWMATGRQSIYDWVKDTGKAIDSLANAAVFRGHPKETVSSHAGRYIQRERVDPTRPAPRWARFVAWLTGLFEPDHTVKAIEESFRELPLKD
jgi:hypothetical protein